uniref:Uncharacterized protein n=1 Tax=Anguilla anguilla TaxID=7936 RepID=A0A0E9SXM1_ANGAN
MFSTILADVQYKHHVSSIFFKVLHFMQIWKDLSQKLSVQYVIHSASFSDLS